MRVTTGTFYPVCRCAAFVLVASSRQSTGFDVLSSGLCRYLCARTGTVALVAAAVRRLRYHQCAVQTLSSGCFTERVYPALSRAVITVPHIRFLT